MKNLNQLFELPVLNYSNLNLNNEEFEYSQLQKLLEEIHEYRIEKDRQEKCQELFDIFQVAFSLLNLFSQDEIDQAYRLNLHKHKNRGIFKILGNYEIFKLIKIR